MSFLVGSLGTLLSEFPDQIFFMLDGLTAHEVLCIGANNSAEDFELYCSDDTMSSKSKGTMDTRGETKEDGRRVGLRKINRKVNGLHPNLKVEMFIFCVLHLFIRVTEKIFFLVVVALADDVQDLVLLRDRLNQFLPGNGIRLGFSENGAAEKPSLNGSKTKAILSRSLRQKSSFLDGILEKPHTISQDACKQVLVDSITNCGLIPFFLKK